MKRGAGRTVNGQKTKRRLGTEPPSGGRQKKSDKPVTHSGKSSEGKKKKRAKTQTQKNRNAAQKKKN